MEFDNLVCKTTGCSWKGVVVPTEANGTEISCSGECGNILRADNPEHPNYPEQPEPEESLEEMIRRIIREESDPSV